jgi:hypothetical protein
MDNRGVTRPIMQAPEHMHSGDMDKSAMRTAHHKQTLWIYWMLAMLGVWLIMTPLTFSFHDGVRQPSGGRSVWLSMADRIRFTRWNDIVSGALLLLFGLLSLKPKWPLSLWACCSIGVWLTCAPVIFWSPLPLAYLNDTFVGLLVIALSILIPGMPNMVMYMKMGSEVPAGWTYNPSSWPQRWMMAVLGFLGFVVSRYLAAYQLGYSDDVWDPFFGHSSVQVLNSQMSQSLPVSDAGLGSIAYTFEFLMGFMGSPARWRTMPWMVTFFGILVIPLGLVHIFLVISQPATVGTWCTFCIAAAAIMLPMIPLEVDEVIAMAQHMKQSLKKGEKFWPVFWKGGVPLDNNKDSRTPELQEIHRMPRPLIRASLWGMNAPFNLVAVMLTGILFMVLPACFHLPVKGGISDADHLGGALLIVFSVVAMGEVVRLIRLANIVAAGILVYYSFTIGNIPAALKTINIVGSLLAILLSIPKGKITEQYGNWQSFIR